MKADLSVAAFSLFVGVATLMLLPSQVGGENLSAITDPYSPAFFPILIAGILIACGAALAGGALMQTPASQNDVRSIEAPLRIAATAGYLLFYGVLIYWIGMVLASIISIICLSYILGFRRHIIIFVTAIVIPLIIYVLFEKMLYVLLPQPRIF